MIVSYYDNTKVIVIRPSLDGDCTITTNHIDEVKNFAEVKEVWIDIHTCSSYDLLDELLNAIPSLSTILTPPSGIPYDEGMQMVISRWIKKINWYTGMSTPWELEAIKDSHLEHLCITQTNDTDVNDILKSFPSTLRRLTLSALDFKWDVWPKIISFLYQDNQLTSIFCPSYPVKPEIRPEIVRALLCHPTLECTGFFDRDVMKKSRSTEVLRMIPLLAQPPVPKDILRHIYSFMI
jgi:hypothetical protein